MKIYIFCGKKVVAEVEVPDKELSMGKDVEKEHAPTVQKIKDSIRDGAITMTEQAIYESIAADHLKEMPDYYTRLKKMEEEGKAAHGKTTKEETGESKESDVTSESAKKKQGLPNPVRTPETFAGHPRILRGEGFESTGGSVQDPLREAWEKDMLFEPSDLTWDKSKLIEDAADLVQSALNKVQGAEVQTERLWLEKIISNIVKDGHLFDGMMEWTAQLRAPRLKTCRVITFPLIIREGKFQGEPTYFSDNNGNLMPFTKAAVINYVQMGIRSRAVNDSADRPLLKILD